MTARSLLLLCTVCSLALCGVAGFLPSTTRISFGSFHRVASRHHFWSTLIARRPHVFIRTQSVQDERFEAPHLPGPFFSESMDYQIRAMSEFDTFVVHLESVQQPGHPSNAIGLSHIKDAWFTLPPHEGWGVYDYPVCLDTTPSETSACANPSVLRVILLPALVQDDDEDDAWHWLETQLRDSPARMHILATGLQVLPEELSYMCWGRYPAARERLLDLVYRHNVSAPLILSGDPHAAQSLKGHCRPATTGHGPASELHEFTVSGMVPLDPMEFAFDQEWGLWWRAYVYHSVMPRMYKSQSAFVSHSVGELDIDWARQVVSARVVGEDGQEHRQTRVTFAELDPRHVSDRTRCEPPSGSPFRVRIAVAHWLWELGSHPVLWALLSVACAFVALLYCCCRCLCCARRAQQQKKE